MSGPFAEPDMSRSGRTGMFLRHRLDPDARRFDEVVKPSLGLVGSNFFNPRRTIDVSTRLAADMIGSSSVAMHRA